MKANTLALIPPEQLCVVTDYRSPLYDERATAPLDEALVKNVMVYGVKEPVLCRKTGERLEVVAGRQRVRAAVEANRRLAEEGKEPIAVRCITEIGDDAEMAGILILENECRTEDSPLLRAKKLQRYLAMGRTEEQAANVFGRPVAYIRSLNKLLSTTKAVQKAVGEGRLSVSSAAKLSELMPEGQDEELKTLLEGGEEARATFAKVFTRVQSAKGKASRSFTAPTKRTVREFSKRWSDKLGDEAKAVLSWVLRGEVTGAVKTILETAEVGHD